MSIAGAVLVLAAILASLWVIGAVAALVYAAIDDRFRGT